jgi:hypothetical protein
MLLGAILFGAFTLLSTVGGYLIVAHQRGRAAGLAGAAAILLFFAALFWGLLLLLRGGGAL